MEFKESIEEIIARKVLRPNGNVALECFTKFWPIIGHDFYKMMLKAIDKGKFRNNVT
jgi:hypothetical protein